MSVVRTESIPFSSLRRDTLFAISEFLNCKEVVLLSLCDKQTRIEMHTTYQVAQK